MTSSYFKLDGWRGVIGSFVIWALYFVIVYAYLSVVCLSGRPDAELDGVNPLTLTLIAITGAALSLIAAVGWIGFKSWRAVGEVKGEKKPAQKRELFTSLLIVMTSGLAFLSTFWVGLPILLLQPCQ